MWVGLESRIVSWGWDKGVGGSGYRESWNRASTLLVVCSLLS